MMADNPGEKKQIKVTLTAQNIVDLKDLARIGRHGGSRAAEVARHLIEIGIRDAVRDDYLKIPEIKKTEN